MHYASRWLHVWLTSGQTGFWMNRTALLLVGILEHNGAAMTIRRWCLAACVGLLVASCGNGEMSMSEYVDAVDAIFQRGMERYEAVVASPHGQVLIVGQGEHLGLSGEGAELTDFTPRDLHVALEQVAEIQAEALQAAAAIDPPDQIADLHTLYFRELPIEELAARADTAADWKELSGTPEMEAYRAALAADNQVCVEFQATLDATADRGAFTDVPWIPRELKEIVEYALGCSDLPQNPQDVYRPHPAQ